jgi:hypothetical protein
MAKNRVEQDPLPAHFGTLRETAEFWDAHDLADYWDLTEEVEIEVELQRTRYLFALTPDLAEGISQQASRRGVSAETLINLWLSEKLHDLVA